MIVSKKIPEKKLYVVYEIPDPVDTIEKQSPKTTISIKYKGGPGSGHRGHAGRPGKVGGSTTGKRKGFEFTNTDGTYHTIPKGWKKRNDRVIERTDGGVTYTIASRGKGGQQSYMLTARRARYRSSVLRRLLDRVTKMISSLID